MAGNPGLLGNFFAGALVCQSEEEASAAASTSDFELGPNPMENADDRGIDPATFSLIAPPANAPGIAPPAWMVYSNQFNGQPANYYAIRVRPPGFTASAQGLITWIQRGSGTYAEVERVIFNYRLDDNHGGSGGIGGGVIAAAIDNENVQPLSGYYTDGSGVKRAVLILGSSTRYVSPGQTFDFLFVAFEGSNANVALTANGELPSWASFAQETGSNANTENWHVTGTAPQTPGVYAFNLHATDGTGVDDTRVFIMVLPPPLPVVSSSTGSVTAGSAVAFNIAATNAPTSYAATGLPTGLAVNAATGEITGTPTVTGTFNVTLGATNAGGTGAGIWSLTVKQVPFPILSNADAAGTVGAAFKYQIVASGTPTAYAATDLPAGLTLNAGTGAIAGTPTAAGTSNVTLSATNAGGTGTQSVVFTVAAASSGGSSGGSGSGSGGSSSGDGDSSSAAETSPYALIKLDLITGALTAQAGALAANHGDAIIFQVQVTPAGVGGVTNLAFTIKEKSEFPQFLDLVSGTGATSPDGGTNFLFPAVAISGPALDASLTIFDDISPTGQVTYSLQFTYTWNGRSRSSQIVDYVVTRDQNFAEATGAGTTGSLMNLGGGDGLATGGGVSSLGLWAWRPDLIDANGGTATSLNTLPTVGLSLGQAVAFAYGGPGGQFCVYELMTDLYSAGRNEYADNTTRFHPTDFDAGTNNVVWYRIL